MSASSCQYCGGPGQCCYTKAKEIETFKKKVLNHFILEVIFEMVISISSVVTDILTLIIYLNKQNWIMAVLTFIPVLLPTTVFTNVYLSDGKGRILTNFQRSLEFKPCAENQIPGIDCQCEDSAVTAAEGEQQLSEGKCNDCRVCCRGLCFSMFHKDRHIRKTGLKIVRKYLRRSAKYFFGTFVLRFIAWTWYLKALIFGYKALKTPKKFMKMQSPDTHWSHELLLRLDFLQAALENAPQCVIQLYALMIDNEENRTLGILTLLFSFLDFIRVATTVHWNIEKGPVQAPSNSYDSLMLQSINTTSWILLYIARCCAIAVLVATSKNWGAVITFGVLILHMGLFAKLFLSKKFGVAAQKILVTAFISLFFLPELNGISVDKLIHFYYAILLLENTCFIIPWNGLESNFCKFFKTTSNTGGNQRPTTVPTVGPRRIQHIFSSIIDETSTHFPAAAAEDCFLQPEVVVLIVATFTVMGVILRLAVARRIGRLNAERLQEEPSTTMHDKIANIYNRKWTNMTMQDLLNSFLHMLKKEVIMPESNITTNTRTSSANSTSNQTNTYCTISVSEELASHINATQSVLEKSLSIIVRNHDTNFKLKNRRSSYSETLNSLSCPKPKYSSGSYPGSPKMKKKTTELNEHIIGNSQALQVQQVVPKLFFEPAIQRNSTSKNFSSFLDDKFPL